MSVLEPSVATPEQNDETELNNLNNGNDESLPSKATSNELISSNLEIPSHEFKEKDQEVFKDENGNVTRVTRKIYSQGVLYSQADFVFSNDPAGKLYMISVTVDKYSNGNIKDSRSVFYANTNEQDITETIETSYVYREDYTVTNARHYNKYDGLIKTVIESKHHSGSSDTSTISYNKDGQITEVINKSKDSDGSKHADVIRFSYKNKLIIKDVKECYANDVLQERVENEYKVLDSNTGETYKSSTITTSYGQKGAVKIDTEYFDKQGDKKIISSETKDSHGQKCIKDTRYSYNDNKYIVNVYERNTINGALNRIVETDFTFLDNNTDEIYKFSVTTKCYGPRGEHDLRSIKNEDFNKQGNITYARERQYINNALNKEIKTEYTVLDSNSGEAYKSTMVIKAYGRGGDKDIKSISRECFDIQGDKVKIVNETHHGSDTKYIQTTYYHYNKDKQVIKSIEEDCTNGILNERTETQYRVSDNITGKVYKSSVLSTHYDQSDIKVIKSECFDQHGNRMKESEKHYIYNMLNNETRTEYTTLGSNPGKTYKSAAIFIKYSIRGGARIESDYFNEQGTIIKKSDALYSNHILTSISEDYFNDLSLRERNVTIKTNYDADGKVSGYKKDEGIYNEYEELIDSQSKEYDIYGQEIINFKGKVIIGPSINSLIEAMGSFFAQESALSGIDFYVENNMLNTSMTTHNQFEVLQ